MVTEPAPAAQKPHSVTHHGITLDDPYHWLRDPKYPTVDDPEILAYLNAENAHFDAWRQDHEAEIETIYEEVIGRIKRDDQSVPVKDGEFEYQWRFADESQYRAWYRRKPGDDFTLLLDENALAGGHDYFNLRSLAPSPSHSLMAYAIDTDGSERYRIYLANLSTPGTEAVQKAENCSGAIVWAADDHGFFYVELNDNLRPYQVRYHALASGQTEDPIIFSEDDPGFFVSIGLTSDEQFVLIECGTHETTEIRLIPRGEPTATPHLVRARQIGIEYSIDCAHDRSFMLINDEHRNFRLIGTDNRPFDQADWQEILSPSDAHYLTSIQCFAEFICIAGRKNGLKGLDVLYYRDLADAKLTAIELDEPACSLTLGDNRTFATKTLRLNLTSMVTPPTVLELALETGVKTILKTQEIPSGYDASQYRSMRLEAKSHDDTMIPITLVQHAGQARPDRVLLYGYGAYGMGMYPSFSAARLSLLDRGFTFAIAHIRGGDEMGYHWYDNGKMAKKTNSFHDFIACAEALVEQGYAEPGNVAAMGGSAGGMLMGAIANMRPDLWRCLVSQVPFVDVLNTMLDDTLPLTPIEWPEWGNPIASADDFERIQSYSPYDNIAAQDYPAMLVTAGISDPRVTYWEPAKYVAKLRATRTNTKPLFLKTNMGAGHFGVSGRFASIKELAETYCFMLDCFDIAAKN